MAAKMANNFRSGKLVVDILNFDDTSNKNKSKKFILSHYFNFSVAIVIPGLQEIPKSIKEILQQNDNSVHFVKLLPVSLIISPEFLNSFCRKGHLYMMSHGTKIDTEDCIAVIPSGKLIMNLTKDTYERLGLEGKKSQFHDIRNHRYVVVVDLLDSSFVPGKKNYERVKWALTDRLNLQYNMLVSWIPNSPDIPCSSISSYFQTNDLLTVPVGLKCRSSQFENIDVPRIRSKEMTDSNGSCDYEELFDWLGSVSCDCINSDDPDGFLPFYQTSDHLKTDCVKYEAQGLVLPQTVEKVVEELKDFVRNEKLDFVSLIVHGFNDTPISWESHEHGFHINGDNLYSYVLFPDETYWRFTALGALDTFI